MTNTVEDVVEDEVEVSEVDEAIRAAFDESVSEESDEDMVKMSMIQAGATFKNVTRLYNQFMIDAGFAISKADRNQIIEDTLEGLDFETEDDFATASKLLESAIAGSTERSAASLVRAYAKKAELPCYAKPKGVGRSGFLSGYFKMLEENVDISEDQAKSYIMGEGDNEDTSPNVQKNILRHLSVWKLVQTIRNA